MNTTARNVRSIPVEGLKDVQVSLQNANLRLHRVDGQFVTIAADDGAEPDEWLSIAYSGPSLSIGQQRTPPGQRPPGWREDQHDDTVHRQGGAPWQERSWPDQGIHETVQSVMNDAVEAIDTAMDTIGATFGEDFLGTFRGQRGRDAGAERRAHAWGQGLVTLSVGIPAGIETLLVAARVQRGEIRASDLWGTQSLRSGNGAIEVSRCGRDCEIHTGRGAITVNTFEGQLHVHSGAGDLMLRECQGAAEVHTGQGTIRLDHCRLQGGCRTGHGDLWLESVQGNGRYHTGSGKIMAIDPHGDELDLHTGMGEIVVEGGSSRSLRLHTGSGAVRCVNVNRIDDLDAHTGMGNIGVDGGAVGRLHMKSGAGSLDCSTTLGRGEHELETGAGNIDVRLKNDAGVRIDAVTRMGHVRSDFDLVKVGRPGPATIGSGRFVGTIGDGDVVATLHIKTGTGNINILRVAAQGPVPAAGSTSGSTISAAAPDPNSAERTRLSVLHSLQRGEITVEEAMALLDRLT